MQKNYKHMDTLSWGLQGSLNNGVCSFESNPEAYFRGIDATKLRTDKM